MWQADMGRVVRSLMRHDYEASKIPQISELVERISNGDSGRTVYEVEGGECVSYALWKQNEVACMRVFLSAGAMFPNHRHGVREIITVYEGRMKIATSTGGIWLERGDTYSIPANVEHHAVADTDCWMIAITVPADEGYTDVGQLEQ